MAYEIFLKKGEEKRVIAGHSWVYANEVAKIEGKDKQGSIAKVVSWDGRFVGYGYINHLSKIIVRILTRDETPIDRTFFLNRIKQADEYRRSLGYKDNYRVVFGESDLLPALFSPSHPPFADHYRGPRSTTIVVRGRPL